MVSQLTADTSHRVDAWLIRSIVVRMLGLTAVVAGLIDVRTGAK